MNNINFFIGEQVTGPLSLDLDNVKGRLTCTMTEKWVRVGYWSDACDIERVYELEKKLGLSVTDREELETAISSTLKLNGIFDLKSEIRDKFGVETRIDQTISKKQSFKFKAPKCGRIEYSVYQLRRLFKFVYQDRRAWILKLFNDNSFSRMTEEWVDAIYGKPVTINPEPSCGCRDPEGEYDGLVNLFLDKIGVLVGYKHKEEIIEFPELNRSFPAKIIENLLHAEITFDRREIPEYLLFLADEKRPQLTGWFGSYVELPEGEFTTQRSKVISTAALSFLIGIGVGVIFEFLRPKELRHVSRTDLRKSLLELRKEFAEMSQTAKEAIHKTSQEASKELENRRTLGR